VGLEDVERFEELEERFLDVLASGLFGAIECHIEECQEDWENFTFGFWILTFICTHHTLLSFFWHGTSSSSFAHASNFLT
jgi:hypothetical protein